MRGGYACRWLGAIAGVVLALAAFASAPAAGAAAGPRYIIVHDGGLPANLLLDDAAKNEALLSSLDSGARATVERRDERPAFELALFYNVPDLSGRTARDLKPDEATVRGRFYPAFEGLVAELELAAVPGLGPRRSGVVASAALDYLVLKGVPVTLDRPLAPIATPTPIPQSAFEPAGGKSSTGVPLLLVVAITGALIVTGGGFALFAWLRGQSPRHRRF